MRDKRGKSETAGRLKRLDRGETGGWNQAFSARGVSRRLVGDCRGSGRGRPALEADGALDGLHDLEVERVAAVACDDVGADRTAEQREIPEQVENLVAHELVAEAKTVQRAAVTEHDRVVERAAAREAVLPHDPEVAQEAVCPRRSELIDERSLGR